MHHYRKLDLLFYRGNSILARMIRYVSKSEQYSHCSIFIDHLHLLETSWRKPNVISHFGYRHTDYDVYRINVELTEEQVQKIMSYLEKRISFSYDFTYFITRGLNYLIGTEVKSSDGKDTCDKLIFRAFLTVGINLLEDGYQLTPDALSHSKHLKIIEKI